MAVLNYAPGPRTPLDCPHCGNPAMSAAAKLWLGPGRTVECKSCGQGVSVAWGRSLAVLSLAFIPFVVLNLALFVLPGAAGKWIWWVAVTAALIGTVAMFRLYVKYVPLVGR